MAVYEKRSVPFDSAIIKQSPYKAMFGTELQVGPLYYCIAFEVNKKKKKISIRRNFENFSKIKSRTKTYLLSETFSKLMVILLLW